MADKKISQLTAASTPLTGSEVLPIVQSSATVKVAVSDLTAGRSISASGATITDGGAIRVYRPGGATYTDQSMAAGGGGGYIFNNANGDGFKWQFTGVDQFVIDVNGNFVQKVAAKGINFTANTPATNMTSQLLNWYEEGTWTPSVTPATGSITTLGTLSGTYTRIGRLVTLTFYIEIVNNGTGGGFGLVVTGLPFTPGKDSFGVCREMASIGTANSCWIDQPNARMIIQTFTAGYPANSGYVFEGTLTYPV